MPRWIVKISRHKDQFRITIPKELAAESGLVGAELVEIKATGYKRLEVSVFEQGRDKKSNGARA